ncbi:hypothetical protein LCGC14_2678140, partial [marine sediment metagenome]
IIYTKLKNELATDERFTDKLDDCGKLMYFCLLLLAGLKENRIPDDPNYIKRVLNLHEKPEIIREKLDIILKVYKKTVSEINKIQEWVDKFKLINDPPFNEFLLFVLFNNSEFDWRTKFNVDLKESPLFSSSNNDIFPFYQRSLSNRYYHLNNGLIKTIYAFKYLLNQPIIDFFKDSYERIEDDVILLDLVIVLCNIPKNVFYAYLPNEDIVYSPENLEPIKNVVIDNLKIEYRKSNLFKKYPNKFISHIIHRRIKNIMARLV